MAKRERLLAWAVGGVVALYLADTVVVSPYFEQRSELARLRAKETEDAHNLFLARRLETNMKARVQLLPTDAEGAEQQIVGAVKEWADKSKDQNDRLGLTLSSVKPERVESKKPVREIRVTASGTGSADGIVKFLFNLQSSKIPVRIVKLTLGVRNENSEERTINLTISTLYTVTGTPKKVADAK